MKPSTRPETPTAVSKQTTRAQLTEKVMHETPKPKTPHVARYPLSSSSFHTAIYTESDKESVEYRSCAYISNKPHLKSAS